jgi:magnesium chelatase family protein
MLARVFSAAVNGIEAYPVEVEVNAGWGDTIVIIVGLPDAAVKESRDRVSTQCPASWLRKQPHASLFLDGDSAGLL